MKEWWKKICDKLYVKFDDFMRNEGGYVLFLFAGIAIVFAIIGFHGTTSFDWGWFLFFEVPLYIFCGWALVKAFKMYRSFLKNMEKKK